jgi:molybdate transport system substrate-binding protein
VHRARVLAAALTTASVLVATAACGPSGTRGAGDRPASGDAGEPVVVRVAAASDLTPVLADIGALVDGVQLEPTYASSGTLVQQIRNGAPYDLLLAADVSYAEQLAEDGAADGDPFVYATGRLALWLRAGVDADVADGLDVLTGPQIRTVAIANPAHAPYGAAARAALEDAGLLDAVQDRLVLGESVAQAAGMLRSGNADAALVSLPAVWEDDAGGTWAEVPMAAPLRQGGVVLADAAQPDAARTVRDALLSPAGAAVLEEHGLGAP